MKSNILVSAIIAAYNEELHLAACIKSLLAQSYKNMEIIVVENGNSRDKTFKIAKLYEKKYKNIRAFSIPGKQKGPGNAWNFGVNKAKGNIILICGADLIYGKNYVKDGLKFLAKSKVPAIIHKEEKCNNLSNLWARAFFKTRSSLDETGLSKVFTIVKKDYLKKRPFNPELGYADDKTIFRKEGTRFSGYDLEIYHTNPASLEDTWSHSLWVGRSIKNSGLTVLMLPFFLIWAVYKTLNHLKTDFYFPFIFFLPVYYSIKYFAYLIEAIKKIICYFL